MNYLNLGCGSNYITEKEWTNLDFVSTSSHVIAHNLLNGIPFVDNSFDLVYHSHVLEHFSKEDGATFITECFRVLRPGGFIRIAIPDLERIARLYLQYVQEGFNNADDEAVKVNYEWMMMEMYDQAVRNFSGGNMARYLFQDHIKNEDFVFERIGEEGKSLRNFLIKSQANSHSINNHHKKPSGSQNIIRVFKGEMRKYILRKLKVDENALAIGKFRLGGEIHQWMYDRHSLYNLLKDKGGRGIQIRDAFTSFVSNWASYNLDAKEGKVRKPDSLFMEAIK